MHPLLLAMLLPVMAAAQGKSVLVVITDSLGNRVPFALVALRSGSTRAADDSGRVTLDIAPADSLVLSVRRLGYAPFDGSIRRSEQFRAYHAILARLPQELSKVNIVAAEDNRLYRNGFYARYADAQKVGTASAFLTPEVLDGKNSARTSQLLSGIPFISIYREENKTFFMGRGRCIANVLLDGRPQSGMVEDVVLPEAAREIYRRAGADAPMNPEERLRRLAVARKEYIRERMSYDELISPGTIAAIEAYASANVAPLELRNQARTPSCTLIAIWTGRRQ